MKNKKILKTLIKLQDEEISTLKRENESLQNIVRKRYSVNKKETIQDVANELDGKKEFKAGGEFINNPENPDTKTKPTGLPESWCVDIRVDDERIKGFKEWFKKGQDIDCNFHFDYYGYSTGQTRWSDGDPYLPQILTLDQFEQMSGVNLMDYVKVKPEVEKRYTKEEILKEIEKYHNDYTFLSDFVKWVKEKM